MTPLLLLLGDDDGPCGVYTLQHTHTWYFWLCAIRASSASPTAPFITPWYTSRLLAFRVNAANALGEGAAREGAEAVGEELCNRQQATCWCQQLAYWPQHRAPS